MFCAANTRKATAVPNTVKLTQNCTKYLKSDCCLRIELLFVTLRNMFTSLTFHQLDNQFLGTAFVSVYDTQASFPAELTNTIRVEIQYTQILQHREWWLLFLPILQERTISLENDGTYSYLHYPLPACIIA